jgi:hypothetical protein
MGAEGRGWGRRYLYAAGMCTLNCVLALARVNVPHVESVKGQFIKIIQDNYHYSKKGINKNKLYL